MIQKTTNYYKKGDIKTMNKDYCKMYFNNFSNFKIYDELTGTDFLLLNLFLRKTEYCNPEKAYGGQTFSISTTAKKDICEKHDIGISSFERSIKHLVDGGIIRRIPDKRGMYQVNPFLYGFGGEADVERFRELCIKNEWFRDSDAKPSKLIRSTSAANIVSIETKSQKRVADRAINRFMEG